jgi:flagellar basal body-associated protein FliL
MIRIIIGVLLVCIFALAVMGFVIEPGTTQEDIDTLIAAMIVLVAPGVGLAFWGASDMKKARKAEREILKMYYRENRVDVNAVAAATGARERLVQKVLTGLRKDGELPGMNM